MAIKLWFNIYYYLDCDSNKDCPWDRPICLGFNGKFYGKCVLNGMK